LGAFIVAIYVNEVDKEGLSPRLGLKLCYSPVEIHRNTRKQERNGTFLLIWRSVPEKATKPVYARQRIFEGVVRPSKLSLLLPKLLLEPGTKQQVLVTWGVTENIGIPQAFLLLPDIIDPNLNGSIARPGADPLCDHPFQTADDRSRQVYAIQQRQSLVFQGTGIVASVHSPRDKARGLNASL